MLHDPTMEVTCDNEGCNDSIYLQLSWSVGGYDLSDSEIEKMLKSDHEWIVDGDKHFCCRVCEKKGG